MEWNNGDGLHVLEREELRALYRRELVPTFPRAERRPLNVMERLVKKGVYDTLALVQDGALLAYAFFWRDGTEYALLDYLGVCADQRGQGVGSAFLAGALARYGTLRGVLAEAEAPSPQCTEEENSLRARRLAFYHRAGFQTLDYEARVFGVRYTMLGYGPNGVESASAMAAQIRLYRSEYAPWLYKKAVEIPCPTLPSTGV